VRSQPDIKSSPADSKMAAVVLGFMTQ